MVIGGETRCGTALVAWPGYLHRFDATSARWPELKNLVVGRLLAGEDCLKPSSPGLEGVPLLPVIAVPVVGGRDGFFDVVQDAADREAADADRRHVARRRSTQIVGREVDL